MGFSGLYNKSSTPISYTGGLYMQESGYEVHVCILFQFKLFPSGSAVVLQTLSVITCRNTKTQILF